MGSLSGFSEFITSNSSSWPSEGPQQQMAVTGGRSSGVEGKELCEAVAFEEPSRIPKLQSCFHQENQEERHGKLLRCLSYSITNPLSGRKTRVDTGQERRHLRFSSFCS